MSQDLEDVLEHIGSFSRFQILLIIVVQMSDATASWGMMIMTLAGATPEWWCTDAMDQDMSGGTTGMINVTSMALGNATSSRQKCPKDGSMCRNITFSSDFSSIVSEWDLVCSRQWAAGIITTVQMAGVTVGALTAGQFGDLFGRKKAIFLAYALLLVTNLVTAFSVSVEMYTAARFFVGFSTGGLLVSSYVVPVEYIGIKYRTFNKILPFWACGTMIMSGLAYLLQDWRRLTVVLSCVGVPFLLTWWFIPESARWLMAQGRFAEAEKILSRIARINKKPPLNTTKLKLLEKIADDYRKGRENQRRYTFVDLLKSCEYFKKTILLFIAWFCCGMMYYGLAFGVKNLQGDRYINLILNALIDIPSTLSLFVSYKLGRRYTVTLFVGLAALCSFGVPILYWTGNATSTIVSALSLTAKLAIMGGWKTIKVFTVEHYPTVVRNIGFGTCDMGARIGSMIAPLLVEFHMISPTIPYITFSVTSVVALVCILCLKETRNQHMPDYLPPNKKHDQPLEKELDDNRSIGTSVSAVSRETVSEYL